MTCLPMTSSPNGGNCTIRGATRRRHAEGRLLMLQNPPSSPGCGGVAEVNCVPESPASQNIWAISPTTPRCRRLLPRWFATWPPHTREPRPHRHQAGGVALHGDPCVTCLSMTSPSNGGNCTIRGATRRRHADRTLLMVQNPHHYPWCHAPSLVQDCPAGRLNREIRRRTDSVGLFPGYRTLRVAGRVTFWLSGAGKSVF